MIRRYSRARRLRRLPALFAVLLLALLLAPTALASAGSGPVTWAPVDSTYGFSETHFVAVPLPAPPGMGATSLGLGAAYGAGFWDAATEVFAMGFINAIPTGAGLPAIGQTELSTGPLPAGTPLKLGFRKAAGQKVDSVAMLGDPNALVSIEPSDPATLTAAT